MDDRRFDSLARLVSAAPTRRGALAGLLGGALAGLAPAAAKTKHQRQGAEGDATGADEGPSGGIGPAVCHRLGKRCSRQRGDRCCGGARCRGSKCRCNGEQKGCHGACIPQTDCCDSAECGGGAICQGGQCLCPSGEKDCAGHCIVEGDCCADSECGPCESCQRGACVTGCQQGQECQNGRCTCTQNSCGGCCAGDVCKDGDSDGACGVLGATCAVCGAHEHCIGGACQCPIGHKNCNGRCIPAADCCTNAECGPCESCQRGACVSGCQQGQECQNGVCSCTSTSCAGCCAGDTCKDGDADGACGVGGAACAICPAHEHCIGGQCQCQSGHKACDGRCIPVGDCCGNSDCGPCESCQRGACVSGCQHGQTCQNGRCTCTASSCSSGCCAGDVCEPGNRDGACGTGGATCAVCQAHADCVGGRCQCEAGFKECQGACIPNDVCCGTCPACQVCQGGNCVAVVDTPPRCCTLPGGGRGVCTGGTCGTSPSIAQCSGYCGSELSGPTLCDVRCPSCSQCVSVGCNGSGIVCDDRGRRTRACIKNDLQGACLFSFCSCPSGTGCNDTNLKCSSICTGR